ncbi:hypothetical protein [Spirosoma foliorum]|uniref:Uncharacterized protein n=1 Tax=Spirosoma foliorum TaxID=2710596 RepID=A0A7G5GYZ8_9BACT|nr:hypothetical protein [Spirosoma foliorum]QMW04090.1 hypothetical protein H3H32_03785 [Spirosoma foliorum]
MLEAEALHREAALLSNKLADFADNDVECRRPFVDQILAIREQWKDVRYEIQTGQKRREEPTPKPTTASQGLQAAEIKLELQKTRVNISKNEKKLREQPDHAKASVWATELARLLAIKDEYEDQLRLLSYETAKRE